MRPPVIINIYQAVLGGAGYKVNENYDPVWRHVRVPDNFLKLVCPMAGSIQSEIVGKWLLNPVAILLMYVSR
jgi:hypothetical protein